jgi:sortase A
MLRRAISGLGRSLITAGVLLLLFVVYQLWGTGIATAQSQSDLRKDLTNQGLNFDPVPSELVNGDGSAIVTVPAAPNSSDPNPSDPNPNASDPTDSVPVTDDIPPVTDGSTAANTVAPSTAPPTTAFGQELVSHNKTTKRVNINPGDAIGRLVIPRISLDDVIVSGADKESLKKGPGHYAKTPMPGEHGNAAIACHRTTFGAPCFRLDELQVGDPILILSKTSGRWFRYNVRKQFVVTPDQNEVLLADGDKNTLTMTTCNPRYSAKQRLVILADLVGEAVEADISVVEQDPLAAQLQAQRDAKNGITTTAAVTVPPTTLAGTSEGTVDTTAAGSNPSSVTTAGDGLGSENDPAVVGPDSGQTVGTDTNPTAPSLDGRTESDKTYNVWFLRGNGSAWVNSMMWALVCAAIWIVAWLVAHDRRKLFVRFAVYSVGFAVFFIPALYFCFVNVSRLLPEAV